MRVLLTTQTTQTIQTIQTTQKTQGVGIRGSSRREPERKRGGIGRRGRSHHRERDDPRGLGEEQEDNRPRHLHVIIMPGFLIASSSPTYVKLRDACAAYLDAAHVHNYTIDVCEMSTVDWLRIALLGDDFRDYLDRAAALVENENENDTTIRRPTVTDTVMVGHSAGGWVGI
jgi:hypothetical protein